MLALFDSSYIHNTVHDVLAGFRTSQSHIDAICSRLIGRFRLFLSLLLLYTFVRNVAGGLQDAPYPGGDPTVQDLCAAAEAAREPGYGAKDPQLPGDVLHRGAEVSWSLSSRVERARVRFLPRNRVRDVGVGPWM